MSDSPRRPRIVISIEGGNIQAVTVDGEVEIVTIDLDNIHAENDDGELDHERIDEHLEFTVTTGTAAGVDLVLFNHRESMMEMAGLNDLEDDREPTPPVAAP